MDHDKFISYSSHDEPIADAICAARADIAIIDICKMQSPLGQLPMFAISSLYFVG